MQAAILFLKMNKNKKNKNKNKNKNKSKKNKNKNNRLLGYTRVPNILYVLSETISSRELL